MRCRPPYNSTRMRRASGSWDNWTAGQERAGLKSARPFLHIGFVGLVLHRRVVAEYAFFGTAWRPFLKRSLAPPLPNRPAALGSPLVGCPAGGFSRKREDLDVNHPVCAGAASALLRRLFISAGTESRSSSLQIRIGTSGPPKAKPRRTDACIRPPGFGALRLPGDHAF